MRTINLLAVLSFQPFSSAMIVAFARFLASVVHQNDHQFVHQLTTSALQLSGRREIRRLSVFQAGLRVPTTVGGMKEV